ncbi:hypothetical protein INS49_003707 [Diaporthe citri]|uniref:uncharacterized protein n=1 Tax=Diaporthe citri TaxID=83186 RepID=UPI001C7E1DC4|nr:uncharacterized protein INS49_003707 [Diaporthe citri]KAG6355742.1 hypothetical protein INS49_003707 [Diaporthe citri]
MSELRYDPEWYELARSVLESAQMRECLPLHDVEGRRKKIEARVRANPFTLPEDIEQTIRYARSQDGHEVPIYHYRKKEPTGSRSFPGPAVVHIHGGGYNTVSAADVMPDLVPYVTAGAEILSIDYRLAPENPFPTPLEDCWAALAWIRSSAAELGIDPKRIALFGESAGGGLAAALAMVARDRGFSPPLSKQILIYPMIDDRTETDHTGGRDVFNMVDRVTSWAAYLGELHRSGRVPPYAAAARISDEHVQGLPRMYIDVAQLDNLLYEVLEYVQKFVKAGVPVEFHLYEGVPHAFHIFAPTSKIARRAFENRLNAILDI